MKTRSILVSSMFAALAVACGSAGSATQDPSSDATEQDISSRRVAVKLSQTNLVSDQATVGAPTTDANLVNAWGIAFNPAGPAWVSNNGSHTTTVYDATGKLLLTVATPAVPSDTDGSAPTGQVFNGSATDFSGDKFILADEHGSLIGWQPSGGAKTRSDQTVGGAVYKGIAIASSKIFVTDFHNGKVDVFDANYTKLTNTGFADPSLPADYAPFGIQELGGKIYVSYAQQDKDKHDDQHGAGKGYVNVFDTAGTLLGRVGSRGALNGPWGLALAPASYGPKLAGKLLVGNFGDGAINAFDVSFTTTSGGDGDGDGDDGYGYGAPKAPPAPVTKAHASFLGSLEGADGKKLAIEGLWAIAVSPAGTMFFTAGPSDESHGLFGTLTVAP